MKLVIGTSVLLWILPLILSEDTPVTCFYSENCVLPCQSNLHDIIHWYKDKNALHSFYENNDQLDHQAQEYKRRTELFLSEINEGNVSLLLKNITLQDEGRYKCYTASDTTNEERYVVVSVVAPVKSVDITLRGDTVTCITSGVYPQPLVWWSSDPPATKPLNTCNKTQENLFVVTSVLKRDDVNVHKYNCSIIKQKDNKTLYTASLEQKEISLQDEVTLQCPLIKNNLIVSTFYTTILKYDSQTSKPQISDEWKDKVSFSPESGTVKLHHLNSEHLGTYTCESSTAQSRYIIRTVIKPTVVKSHITVAIVVPLLVILSVIILYVIRKKLPCNKNNKNNKKESPAGGPAPEEGSKETAENLLKPKTETNGTTETMDL